ncbi:membralin-like protein At1g60995 isoform X2 [Aristolochia californica]|uniref:membralin-like protein At1g60995 isoform X2 n=1 Tax=Aristolochia californica TaxID=171875 RepID=UPI0035E093B6
MDPEQTFLRVHARLSGMLLRVLTPKFRTAMEYIHLLVAIAFFCSLVVMHANFVQQPGCSSELSGAKLADADLVQIKISSGGLWLQNPFDSDFENVPQRKSSSASLKVLELEGDGMSFLAAKYWLNWIVSGSRRSKVHKSWKNDRELADPSVENSAESKEIVNGPESRSDTEISQNTAGSDMRLDNSKSSDINHLEGSGSFIVQWLENRSKAFEPTYLYAVEKGYFLLSEDAKSLHNVRTINITISSQHSCFGNRWQQLLINGLIGYDTILMNSLLNFSGQGYLYNFQRREKIYDLSYAYEPAEGSKGFEGYLVTKCGVLIMSLFVFFTTTMSVSFTLRETQSRMLKFTVQLQHHARHRLPTFQLVFVHVIESLVFVPIMIGTLFFLFEFYDDQLLAFMVLILVWLCELFTLISVRTPLSIQFFPRFFLLYFLVFHIYFFSYPYGFSYLAFATTAAFMYHLILYFWNHFEVPALERFMWNRQQPGIHITSSILTSTLHIARLNMRNTIPANDASSTGPATDFNLASDQPDPIVDGPGSSSPREQMVTDNPDTAGRPLQFPQSDSPQPGISPNSNSLNPFSSLLLGILGGTPESHVSFFSMFRDMRDTQQQVYNESSQQVNRSMNQNSWWRRIS